MAVLPGNQLTSDMTHTALSWTKGLSSTGSLLSLRSLLSQENEICTLKGSLRCFKFLEQLDLSNNQLRNMAKVVKTLSFFKILTHLNLKVRCVSHIAR